MRILITTTDYLPNISGIATLAFEQAYGLSALGHQVCVVTTIGGSADHNGAGSFEVFVCKSTAPPVFRLTGLFRAVSHAIEQFNPDFIWCANYRGFGLPVYYEATRHKIQYGLYLHGTELISENKSLLRRSILKKVIQNAAVLCSNSCYTSSLAVSLYDATTNAVTPGVSPPPPDDDFRLLEKAQLIRNRWLSNRQKKCGNGQPVIFISSCRVTWEKGIGTVLEGLSKLERELRDQIVYVISGTGPALEEFARFSKSLGLDDVVIFSGYAAKDDLPAVLQAADVYLQPSQPHGDYIEGFGISFLEAQAAGLPCIASDWCGIPEAVKQDITAILVPPCSATAVAQAIERVIIDKPWRDAAAIAGPVWAGENTWSLHSKKLERILAEAATQAGIVATVA